MAFRASMAFLCVAAGAVALLTFAGPLEAADGESLAAGSRVFELRTYTTNEGKLGALHARFRDHTSYLFVRHGMTLVGYWTPTDGDEAGNTLVYLLAHDSRDSASKSWRSFISDPEWKKVYADSRANGALVKKVESKFLAPTDYSPLR